MATATFVPVAEYLRTSYEPACEYIDGVLRPKSMGTKKHALLQHRLCKAIERQGYQALPEITVRVAQTRYLIPDVAVDREIEDPYPTKPVPLVIEVLSPEDRLGAALAKCEEYHQWGVPVCWVIDPERQTAWEYRKGGEPTKIDRRGTMTASEISVELDEMFAVKPDSGS